MNREGPDWGVSRRTLQLGSTKKSSGMLQGNGPLELELDAQAQALHRSSVIFKTGRQIA